MYVKAIASYIKFMSKSHSSVSSNIFLILLINKYEDKAAAFRMWKDCFDVINKIDVFI